MPPLCSIILVNYNGRHFLKNCLQSIAEQEAPAHCYEVIVVDNASSDGSVEWLRAVFPWVVVIPLEANLGFGRANVIGVERSHGEFLIFLNNDTVVDPHWLSELMAVARKTDAGLVAAKLVIHSDPTILNSTGLFLLCDGRGIDQGFRLHDDGRWEHIDEVFGGCGAALLVKRSMFAEEELFDPRLFMYCEDLDLAWRGRLRGVGCLRASAALVRHIHCGTAGEGSPFFRYHVERNRTLVSLSNGDWILAISAVFGGWLRVVREGLRALRSRRIALLRAVLYAQVSVLSCLPIVLLRRTVRRYTKQSIVPESARD